MPCASSTTVLPLAQNPHRTSKRLKPRKAWGSYLAPSPSQNPQLATSQRPAQTPPQLVDDASQNSERKSGTESQLVASENKTPAVGAKPEPVEWAKIVLAAQMHSEASVSSPTVEDRSSIGSSTPTQV